MQDLASLHSLNSDQHDWMRRSLAQMQSDSALTANVSLRNDLLRVQLAGTLLRLSLWQTGEPSRPLDSGQQEKFRRFCDLLEANFSTHHQVRHYAATMGMSEKSLGRACAAVAGIPAKACIAQRISLEAKRLLAHTNSRVQSIGLELGFDDATNFVKFFRSANGITPLEFRRRHTGTSG